MNSCVLDYMILNIPWLFLALWDMVYIISGVINFILISAVSAEIQIDNSYIIYALDFSCMLLSDCRSLLLDQFCIYHFHS